MAEDLFIPKLGQTVEEVVLINWLVDDGEQVDFGDPVLEVETDKAIFNVEANAKGHIHFGPYDIGETVSVLTVVASIGEEGEGFSPSEDVIKSSERPNQLGDGESKLIDKSSTQKQPDAKIVRKEGKVFASPRARKFAKQNNIDLSFVTPTGGGGVRITEDDVKAYLSQQPKATPLAAAFAKEMNIDISNLAGSGVQGKVTRTDVEKEIRRRLIAKQSELIIDMPEINHFPNNIIETKPIEGIQKIIFDRMQTSDKFTARVTLISEVDATELVRIREKIKAEKQRDWGVKVGYNELLGMIVARALREYPYMNARLSEVGDQIEILEDINLGFAVDTDRGLLVPVVKNADQLDLQSLGARFHQLVSNAQSSRISPEELSGGTFTITNLGGYGVDGFTPVINLPELAILGIGEIRDKVVPYQGEITIRKMMTLSLVFDHRLVDGAPAARFLKKIKEMIEDTAIYLNTLNH